MNLNPFATRFALLATIIYLIVGLTMGFVMQHYLPAMNTLGVGFYALTWPAELIDGTFHTKLVTIPDWVFTFK
jgi:hypothetical protein